MLSPPCGRAWLALRRCRVLGLGRPAEPPVRRSAAVLAGGALGLGVGGEARGRGGEVVPVAGHEAPAVASRVLLVDVEAQGSRPPGSWPPSPRRRARAWSCVVRWPFRPPLCPLSRRCRSGSER